MYAVAHNTFLISKCEWKHQQIYFFKQMFFWLAHLWKYRIFADSLISAQQVKRFLLFFCQSFFSLFFHVGQPTHGVIQNDGVNEKDPSSWMLMPDGSGAGLPVLVPSDYTSFWEVIVMLVLSCCQGLIMSRKRKKNKTKTKLYSPPWRMRPTVHTLLQVGSARIGTEEAFSWIAAVRCVRPQSGCAVCVALSSC